MTWQSLTPQERGDICERIHRRLTAHHAHTDTALMHALGLPIDQVRAALSDMEKRGAVRKPDSDAKVKTWSAVARPR